MTNLTFFTDTKFQPPFNSD